MLGRGSFRGSEHASRERVYDRGSPKGLGAMTCRHNARQRCKDSRCLASPPGGNRHVPLDSHDDP
eukprot:6745283-Prorocentrum_lima.AAC.1